MALPSGGDVTVSPEMGARLAFLRRFVETVPGEPVLYGPCGSGWHYAYRVPHVTRHTWFYPGAIRPYEQQEFVRSLDRTAAVVTCDDPGSQPTPLSTALPLDEEIHGAVYDRLEPWMAEAGCRVYRVRR